MIHHEGTKGTKMFWGTERIRERSHLKLLVLSGSKAPFRERDPFVPSW